MADLQNTNQDDVLEQQRVLAEFGERALKTEALDDILNKGRELVGRALNTALARSWNSCPMAKLSKFAQAMAGSLAASVT